MRNQTELARRYSDALQIVATCRNVPHSHVADVRRSLPDTIDSVVCFDADIAVAEPRQTEKAVPSQASESDIEIGSTKDQ